MVELLDMLWGLVYVISFLGSLSFGYLILRFNIPDIRIVPREAKLGLSGIIGIILFALSLVMSYLIGLNFLIFIPLWTLIFTGLFELKQMAFGRKEVTVAIPVVKMELPPEPEKKVQMRPRAIPPRVLDERQISERGAFVRESYSPHEEKLIVERTEPIKQQSPERPEIIPQEEQKYVQSARERFKERLEQQKMEEEARKARQEAMGVPEGKPIESRAEEGGRRRYAERRGEMIEEVKTDMFRASEKREREKYEKELFSESAPASELSIEELGEGLDVEDLEKIGSLDELGSLEEMGSISDKDLETLAGIAKGDLAGVAERERIPTEKGLSCPKCRSTKSTIVYCPYCGKGFCSNCSDKIERKGELVFYGCPHCKKDVIVKGEG